MSDAGCKARATIILVRATMVLICATMVLPAWRATRAEKPAPGW